MHFTLLFSLLLTALFSHGVFAKPAVWHNPLAVRQSDCGTGCSSADIGILENIGNCALGDFGCACPLYNQLSSSCLQCQIQDDATGEISGLCTTDEYTSYTGFSATATSSAPGSTSTSESLWQCTKSSCLNSTEISVLTSFITCGLHWSCLCTDWETVVSSACVDCVLNYFDVPLQTLKSWCAASTTWSIASSATSSSSTHTTSGAKSTGFIEMSMKWALGILAGIAGGMALVF